MNFKGKTLYRNMQNKMIAGVCSGLADYLKFDVSLIRLLFVASMFFGGLGFVVYVVAMFVVPDGSGMDVNS